MRRGIYLLPTLFTVAHRCRLVAIVMRAEGRAAAVPEAADEPALR